ncbi:MAG: hypothetical protein QFB87_03315 [Patescibacteria group bacterium]|nr:hypothetical protein [Patescibacteria group bacterium]
MTTNNETIKPISALWNPGEKEWISSYLHALFTKTKQREVLKDFFVARNLGEVISTYSSKQLRTANEAILKADDLHKQRTLGTFVLRASNGNFQGIAEINPHSKLRKRVIKPVSNKLVPISKLQIPNPKTLIPKPQPVTGPFVRAWTIPGYGETGGRTLTAALKALADPNGIASDFYDVYSAENPEQAGPVRAYTVEPLTAKDWVHKAIRHAGLVKADSGYFDDNSTYLSLPNISNLYIAPALDN